MSFLILLRLHFSSHNTSTRGNSKEIVVETEHFEVARLMGPVYRGSTLISLTGIEIETKRHQTVESVESTLDNRPLLLKVSNSCPRTKF